MKAFLAAHFEKVFLAIALIVSIYFLYTDISDLLTPSGGAEVGTTTTKALIEDFRSKMSSGGGEMTPAADIITEQEKAEKAVMDIALMPRTNVFYHDMPVFQQIVGTHKHQWSDPYFDREKDGWYKKCLTCGLIIPVIGKVLPPRNLRVVRDGFAVKITWEDPDFNVMAKDDMVAMHIFRKTEDENWNNLLLVPSRHLDGLLANGILEKKGDGYVGAEGANKGKTVRISVCSVWFVKEKVKRPGNRGQPDIEEEVIKIYPDKGVSYKTVMGEIRMYEFVDREVMPNETYQYRAMTEAPQLEKDRGNEANGNNN